MPSILAILCPYGHADPELPDFMIFQGKIASQILLDITQCLNRCMHVHTHTHTQRYIHTLNLPRLQGTFGP